MGVLILLLIKVFGEWIKNQHHFFNVLIKNHVLEIIEKILVIMTNNMHKGCVRLDIKEYYVNNVMMDMIKFLN